MRVALVARSADALHALAKQIGSGAIAIPCDLQQPDAADVVASALQAASNGAPDVIVNNAGAFLIAPAHETTMSAFRRVLDVNLVGPFSLVRRFLPQMLERGSGHLVTIGSIADHSTFPGNAAYAASKYGLRALHEVLRAELRGTGVRATLVSPGPVDTELWDPIDPDHQPGFTPRSSMLAADAVAAAVYYALAAPPSVNVDELRLSRS